MRKVTTMGEKIGSVIRQARKAAGKKQGELADALGVPQSQVSDWERGAVVPGVESLKKIGPAIHIDVSVLIGALVNS
jgi:transcriptional regulator with XRE-family HTH domain